MEDKGNVATIVTKAWRSTLDLDEVTDQDFFELGGNSLMAVSLVQQIEAALGIRFPLQAFFLDGRLSAMIDECELAVGQRQLG